MAEVIQRSALKRGALALLLMALVAPVEAVTGDDDRFPDLGDCQELQVEEGNKVAFVAYAEGVQIYRWTGTAWDFVAPEALLYSGDDEGDGIIGTHYAGPTWESVSGSEVVGKVIDKCFPDADAIPWLLLEAKSSDGPGIFNRVTFIQRLYTVGGVAPAAPGDCVGEEARVPYTAWYVFYRKQ